MNFLAEERETIILSNDSSKVWEVYTMQQKIMNKMKSIGVEPTKTEKDNEGNIISCTYIIPYKQISFRKIIELTEEQKQAKSERMKNMRDKIKNN